MTREEKKAYDHARVIARQKRLADPTKTTRFCRTCQTTKPAVDFYPSCETRCRSCEQSKAALRRDERLKYLAEWRRRHPDAFREWTLEHRDERIKYAAQWRADNPERHRENYRRWAKANPDRVNALLMKRYARKRHATPAWANFEAIRAFYRKAHRLTIETGVRHEVDHIVPLQSPFVCGLHVEYNLQILTSLENKKKRNYLHAAHKPVSTDFLRTAAANLAVSSFDLPDAFGSGSAGAGAGGGVTAGLSVPSNTRG